MQSQSSVELWNYFLIYQDNPMFSYNSFTDIIKPLYKYMYFLKSFHEESHILSFLYHLF